MKVYGYIRVSSDKQTVENQRYKINKFCEKVLKFIAYQRIRAETYILLLFPPDIKLRLMSKILVFSQYSSKLQLFRHFITTNVIIYEKRR